MKMGSEDQKSEPHSEHYESTLPGVIGMFDNAISRIESVMLALGVMLMAVNTIANVISRAIGSTIFFSEELNRILIILITFAGIGYAARHGRHIRMSALYDALPPKTRKVLMIVITVITALTMFALCYFAVGYIAKVAKSGRVLSAMQIPVYWIYLWVPVGFFITGVQYALTALKNVVQKDIYLSTHVLEGYEEDEIEI
ncbi:TRAP transporter small permease [Nitratireductor sp. L1-7-SE]|uniref:TRAP transporter small permease protein n=2 Tax=Nitratireductor rhodophyticola TaxID=2854036 RepID=A0ABS7RB26_9HYPH|nr:TRAP transporter small permease [Nitratireductor rhodophyticola]MBY8916670.1 TRAP transporter small permease [Nitratireductor rhodophyticola]MBY8922034.1 TRAP transporter small permease [Nitratireductor rhodophyticola]MEC9247010.1 TRAP transporter small permease [Pseudomonadota bacterium]